MIFDPVNENELVHESRMENNEALDKLLLTKWVSQYLLSNTVSHRVIFDECVNENIHGEILNYDTYFGRRIDNILFSFRRNDAERERAVEFFSNMLNEIKRRIRRSIEHAVENGLIRKADYDDDFKTFDEKLNDFLE